jgi:hypothetical protein
MYFICTIECLIDWPLAEFVTRMGAKVEGESYMPGYYATWGLNMEPTGRWSSHYEDRTSNGQLCNGFTTKPTNGNSEIDKEMLKHQMLEHEAVFREQVRIHQILSILTQHTIYFFLINCFFM